MTTQYFANVVGFLDTQVLENRFYKDPVFLSEILDRYQKTCTDCISDLKSASKNSDAVGFANAAHKLKGSTLNFSKFYIANWLEELEAAARLKNEIPASAEELEHLDSLLRELIMQLQDLGNRWRQSTQIKIQ